jgi:glycosyltransferase involved in cell wall biosynthesis
MVIHYPFFGGPHNQALRLRIPLEELGIFTTVALPAEPGNAAARLRAAGVDVVELRLHRLRASRSVRLQANFVRGFWGDVRRLRHLIRSTGIEVVEVNGLVNPQAAIAARLENVPVVWQLLDTRPPMPLRRLLMPLVTRLADCVMSTGRGVAAVHPGALGVGERLVLFFPPVDTQAFRPDGDRSAAARKELGLDLERPVVGTVANLTPQKGLEHFIAMAQTLRAHRPETQFVILGSPMETHLRYANTIVRAAEGLAQIVAPDDRVAALLPAFDVFVMTSVARSEGISTTVLEAMSTGIPIVTTDVGALREAVADGREGRVVAPEDIGGLMSAVKDLLDNDRERIRMGAAARTKAEALFSVEMCADTHARAIQRATLRGAN